MHVGEREATTRCVSVFHLRDFSCLLCTSRVLSLSLSFSVFRSVRLNFLLGRWKRKGSCKAGKRTQQKTTHARSVLHIQHRPPRASRHSRATPSSTHSHTHTHVHVPAGKRSPSSWCVRACAYHNRDGWCGACCVRALTQARSVGCTAAKPTNLPAAAPPASA